MMGGQHPPRPGGQAPGQSKQALGCVMGQQRTLMGSWCESATFGGGGGLPPLGGCWDRWAGQGHRALPGLMGQWLMKSCTPGGLHPMLNVLHWGMMGPMGQWFHALGGPMGQWFHAHQAGKSACIASRQHFQFHLESRPDMQQHRPAEAGQAGQRALPLLQRPLTAAGSCLSLPC
jgi:hypothetical protein